MLRSLVGSEMCIRDSNSPLHPERKESLTLFTREKGLKLIEVRLRHPWRNARCITVTLERGRRSILVREEHPERKELPSCLLYTSDAADEEDSVDLGGRRIIKKKKRRRYRGGGKTKKETSKRSSNDEQVTSDGV
eukprot:TRINITY_DN26851_c0_g2_i1.p2 TRINITY_DN26851_c0_g2~~TRINITY_DN26851_c0_g2_i1.p2  ORF type:complete len:135 (-),score=20.20 TRINITY_DN26851_c0_g2_i1:20-424(-)